ncbi:MAG TPA: 16S rRNA (adenine(1518)-N(6)/adenine(1519)-N(6))-dimethyltransferase RsmA [Candidatus Bathyarchaeia archaeon]|nr:16S rRNA (adenine(1518)-N(6)/adenine(1519)-N(6))-dimethyltransferase RsmA [Candidatus Bathyarchaeia archaeon]
MGLEETKHLLRSFRIVPNKLLGQNFMVEPAVYPKLCEYAFLGREDVVLDAGAGFGFLTRFLACTCKAVVAVEKDPRVALVLREQVQGYVNVTVVQGDVLKAELPAFNKVIAVPPYYLSSRLVVWLLQRQTDCSVLILQKEFVDRLLAPVGTENYGWLTVVAFHDAQVELLDALPKTVFYPQPPVDSVIVRLTPWKAAPFEVRNAEFFNLLVRWLFTQRNRKLSNSLAPFVRSKFKVGKKEAEQLARDVPFVNRRARELSPGEFGELANVLAK